MQDALNGEQRLFAERIARERAEIQRAKDQLLDDQKVALATIYESRSQLANERAKVEATEKAFQDQKQRDMLQAASVGLGALRECAVNVSLSNVDRSRSARAAEARGRADGTSGEARARNHET